MGCGSLRFLSGKKCCDLGSLFKHRQIRVEEQEDDFLIKVFTTRNCQGLLVFILEAFEELSLEVLQARVSTSDSFILEAIATRVRGQVEIFSAKHFYAQAYILVPYPLTYGVCKHTVIACKVSYVYIVNEL